MADFKALAERIANPFGAPDILADAASMNFRQHWNELTRESSDATLAVDLTVPFSSPATRRWDAASGQGNIMISHRCSPIVRFPTVLPIAPRKAASSNLPEQWRKLGRALVLTNAIAPGMFPTGLTAPVFDSPDLASRFAAMTAIGAMAKCPTSTAPRFLASRAAAYVTGRVLPVNGGYLASEVTMKALVYTVARHGHP